MGIHLTVTAGVALWVLFSLIVALGGTRSAAAKGPRISAAADKPEELRRCNRLLEGLLTDLHRETFAIPTTALRFDTDPSAEWRNWSRTWRMRWRALAWRCRFDDLAGSGTSEAIDTMAEIHSALDELQRSYSGVVDTFIERHLERLRALRKSLTQVRNLIDRADPTAPASHSEPGARRQK